MQKKVKLPQGISIHGIANIGMSGGDFGLSAELQITIPEKQHGKGHVSTCNNLKSCLIFLASSLSTFQRFSKRRIAIVTAGYSISPTS